MTKMSWRNAEVSDYTGWTDFMRRMYTETEGAVEFANKKQVSAANRLARYNESVAPQLMNWHDIRHALAQVWLHFKIEERIHAASTLEEPSQNGSAAAPLVAT